MLNQEALALCVALRAGIGTFVAFGRHAKECNNPRVANRDRHRQGLVYGPVRPSGPRDRGRIVGNLLGLLVVVVTVSVLGIAIYFFIQARNNEPAPISTATPSAAAVAASSASPSASLGVEASPTIGPTSDPTPTPSPAPTAVPITPTPEATPAPTFTPPAVAVGPGSITFGTNGDSNYRVTDPKTTFGIDEPMVWSAYLTQPADSADMIIRIWRLDSPDQAEPLLVREDAVTPNVRGVQIFFRRLRPIGASAGPGLFRIAYIRGDQVLSEGSFLVQ